ncbi:fused MFS/spermidine synthase [candidate division WOR-3 bacterium]|nr:fused MFS/spermidine synthase [candidate division WOR-3 bacterium]
MFALLFGTTTLALAVVIAVFLMGMGLGSLYFGRQADRTHYPVRMFALCNFGTVLGALIVFAATHPASRLYPILRHWFALQGNPLGVTVVISFILMILPTFFMGAILPLLGRMYVARREQIGKGISRLYMLHTTGNIIGALLTAYVLIPVLGHTFTHFVAMIITSSAGLLVIVFPASFHYEIIPVSKPLARKNPRTTHGNATLLLVIAGIIGFCALAFEILWMRVLRTYVTNSTYSITNVLIIYLVGVSLGSFIYFRWMHRKAHLWLLATGQLVIGGYSLAALISLNRLPVLLFWIRDLLAIPLLRVALPGILISATLFFIPAFVMGLTFPLLCHMYARRVEHLARGIGRVYFVNTFCGVAGSIVATLILLPLAGITRGIGFIALFICGSALLTLGLDRGSKWSMRSTMVLGSAFVSTLILFIAGFRHTMILPPSLSRSTLRFEQILYYKETSDGTVIVTEEMHTGIRACYINNNAVCGTTYDALKVVKMLGHVPCLFNPAAHRACVIGFGIGITTSSIAQHDLESIDCVEICPGVFDAAHFFTTYNRGIIANKKVHLLSEDGRIHLLATGTRYDIISCDPTHPTLGCNNLYTREYFELCKSRLATGGVVCQYLPLHKLSLHEFKMVIRTFISVFPHATFWLAHAHAVMVGTLHEQHLDFDEMTGILHRVNDNIIYDPYDLACSLILDEHAARAFAGTGPLNTDDHPYLEFFSPASTTKSNWDNNLYQMLCWRIEPTTIIHGVPDTLKLRQYIAAQQYFLSALIFKNRGQLDDMLKAMETAHSINPASAEILFFLEHERSQLQTLQR